MAIQDNRDIYEQPVSVLEIERYLKKCEEDRGERIWFRIEASPAADKGCTDAVDKRERLGHKIPLWDELKTMVYECRVGGQTKWVAVHLRGDRQIVMAKLVSLLALDTDSTAPSCGEKKADLAILDMGCATINPFLLEVRHKATKGDSRGVPELLHVIDEDLFCPEKLPSTGPPVTVMTNAGHAEWSIEFEPHILEKCLNNITRGAISVCQSDLPIKKWGAREAKTLGIITGSSPESGSLLWDLVNKNIRVELNRTGGSRGDFSLPRTYIHSLPEMGFSMELDKREAQVWNVIRKAVVELCELGTDILALACNTTQYYRDLIEECIKEKASSDANVRDRRFAKTSFLSMPECLAKVLVANEIKEVGLIGISFVSEGKYSAYDSVFKAYGIEMDTLNASESTLVFETAMRTKEKGADWSSIPIFKKICQRMAPQHIVIALTELSVMLNAHGKHRRVENKRIIDPLTIYATAIAYECLGKEFPVPGKKPEEYYI